MNEEQLNMQIRKFLKQVGIKSQREIEQGIRRAAENGALAPGQSVRAAMRLTVPEIGIDVTIDGDISVD
jgi:hypothetical protein